MENYVMYCIFNPLYFRINNNRIVELQFIAEQKKNER